MITPSQGVKSVVKAYGDQNKIGKNDKIEKTASKQQPDEVVLSSQAQEFGQYLQKIKAMPEVREEVVKELADKIAAGNYRVDSQAVAEKILGYSLPTNWR
ncbi:flagellar biosynthesis anti-sigma factor FlgM [Sporomusa sp. KB1]|jgi:negative regulator of flagellin synthesis FlgM|uniref:flagellar biosynthesis anti-sigma factor FlgM n=1 Tax=Sporomusa sp. KB1 TaxID=943346 RepID=UPI0011A5D9D5|nr:flagellar biosynthesis anti-sigma factor FlgM [Sporomusa sp. KB1]TWH45245.1 FlgM family anti-sigma-28 factor [Sporomusa sp. KB1]